MSSDIDAYVSLWGLDDTSRELLVGLAAEQQEGVLEGFAPKPETKDVNRLFCGYVRSVAGRGVPGNGHAARDFVTGRRSSSEDQCLSCSDWCQHNGLHDPACTNELLALSTDQRQEVMLNFRPKEGTNNPIGLFISFCRSIKGKGNYCGKGYSSGKGKSGFIRSAPYQDRASPEITLDEYQVCSDWCLGQGLQEQACIDALSALSPDQRQEVTSSFQPKEGTRNPVGLFLSFCRSIRANAAVSGTNSGPANPTGVPRGTSTQRSFGNGGDDHQFCADWCREHGLRDDACIDTLLALAPDQREEVMSRFVLPEGTDDPVGSFMSHCRSIWTNFVPGHGEAGGSESDDYQVCADWCLDQGLEEQVCMDTLLALLPDQRHEVISNFSPREGTHNLTGKFLSYCRSIQSGSAHSTGNPGFNSNRSGLRATSAEQTDEYHMCSSWCRDHDLHEKACIDALYVLSANKRHEVMSNFKPKDGTSNPVGLFVSYCRSIRNSSVPGNGSPGKGQAKVGQARLWGELDADGSDDLVDVSNFLEQWGLDETCGNALRAADAETQRRVVDLFSPKGDAHRSLNARFHNFLASVATRVEDEKQGPTSLAHVQLGRPPVKRPLQAQGDMVRQFGEFFCLDEACVGALSGQSAEVQHMCFENFLPKAGTRNTSALFMKYLDSICQNLPATSWGDPVKQVDDFVTYWRLDATCGAALAKQPAHVRETVFAGFVPGPDTRNPNSLFMSYLTSIAREGGPRQYGAVGKGRY